MSDPLADRIEQAIIEMPDASHDEIAEYVAASYRTLRAYREATHHLLAGEVRRERRMAARHIESQVRRSRRPANGPGESVDPAAMRQAWLAERIFVPGRDDVTWGAATVDDHRARIEYLERLRAGISETIGLHERAIKEIENAGVTCLAELDEPLGDHD